jgi:hypothetical protein
MLPSTERLGKPDDVRGDTVIADEENLVSDARGELTPSQVVEQKLMTRLWGDAATSC